MKLKNVLIVYRKELTDFLRDRRTLVGTFIWPLVLFPLMTVGFGQVAKKVADRAEQRGAAIMVLGEANAPQLTAQLRRTEGLTLVPAPMESGPAAAGYAQRINSKELQAAVEFPDGFEQKAESGAEPPKVNLYYYQTELRSEATVDRIEKVLQAYRKEVMVRRLAVRGVSPNLLEPINTVAQNVASAEKVGGVKLGVLLPYFIILLCLMSALHPAMDLTAGEKERGTMETILASSVGRSELVMGKFFLVLSFSLFNTILSLASFGVTMRVAKDYAAEMTRGQPFAVSPKAMLLVFLIVLPLAVLFAAGLLTISLFAKSYKEAQSYSGYVMIAAIIPAVISMLPGVELNNTLAVVPIVNVSLVSKEIFTGTFPWSSIGVVLASTVVYASAALWLAVKMFQREDVLFRA